MITPKTPRDEYDEQVAAHNRGFNLAMQEIVDGREPAPQPPHPGDYSDWLMEQILHELRKPRELDFSQ